MKRIRWKRLGLALGLPLYLLLGTTLTNIYAMPFLQETGHIGEGWQMATPMVLWVLSFLIVILLLVAFPLFVLAVVNLFEWLTEERE